jgi:hypothetical protein
MACALAKELAAFLVEEHVAADAQVRPSPRRPPCCPKCQQAGQRVTKERGASAHHQGWRDRTAA